MNDDATPGAMNIPNSQPERGAAPVDLGRLSSLVDGELEADAAALGCLDWRDDRSARVAWHRYHLIGDVLRSEQLSSTSGRDDAFLQAFRARLAKEPVVLAPEPSAAAEPVRSRQSARRLAWFPPVVVAAGFAAVAGVLVISRFSTPVTEGSPTAIAAAPAASSELQRARLTAEAAPAMVVDQQLVRDARLDRYFEAHRGALTGNALGVPGGSLRSVDTLWPQR